MLELAKIDDFKLHSGCDGQTVTRVTEIEVVGTNFKITRWSGLECPSREPRTDMHETVYKNDGSYGKSKNHRNFYRKGRISALRQTIKEIEKILKRRGELI